MPSKLEMIVEQRRQDVAAARQATDEAALRERAARLEAELGPPRDLHAAIAAHRRASEELFVAAEFKRASPSKGDIATDLDAGEQAARYASAGAGLVSVLTEPKWFKGNLDDMEAARRAVNAQASERLGGRPLVLRKDFIIDDFQLLEARAYGADTVLLMLSILSEAETKALIDKAQALGMTPLVEVVNEVEMKAALRAGARVIGVNNRNLHTFKVDLMTTPRMVEVARAAGVLDEVAILALSGIKSRTQVKLYEAHGGVSGLLVGETLMRASDPGAMIADLVRDADGEGAQADRRTRVKICGITDAAAATAAAAAGADLIGLIFVSKSARCVSVDQAKAIVQAVREFRELDCRIELACPPQGDAPRWFRACADALGAACGGQGRPLVVGVFMGQPVAEVNRIAMATGIDLIQLHGGETPAFEAQCCLPTVRVVHVDVEATATGSSTPVGAGRLVDGPACALLLDTAVKGGASGGTGKTFDWNIARDLGHGDGGDGRGPLPLVMAGGLTPDNVAQAVETARPWGVDVASGVEVDGQPGVKDHDKIKAFVRAAKSVELC